jgi:hypothetical protein
VHRLPAVDGGFTFPLCVYAVVTPIVAKSINVAAIADFGVVPVAMLAVLWLIVAAQTAIGARRGDPFVAPCLMGTLALWPWARIEQSSR